MVVIPVSLLVLLAVVQISAMVRSVSGWVSRTDLSSLGDRTLVLINDAHRPGAVPHGRRRDAGIAPRPHDARSGRRAANTCCTFCRAPWAAWSAPSPPRCSSSTSSSRCSPTASACRLLIRQLNPLGEEVTDLYLEKMGAMVRGTVLGPVRHRAGPGHRRRRLDLHRRLPRRLLHLRDPADRAVGHPAGRRHRVDAIRHRHESCSATSGVACSSSHGISSW